MDLRTDFLVVGSGIAGLRAAAALADAGRVLILTKAEPIDGSTAYAQGGIAAALGADDSPERHAADTLLAGDGLCHEAAVRVLTEEGPGYVEELIRWGARFDRDAGGRPALAREGAHSVRRVLHARDATGREISRTLWERVSRHPAVDINAHALVTDLIVGERRCVGVRLLDAAGKSRVATARAVLLATGGAGHVFRETTNPPVATGDGVAIAYRAGVRVVDLEFVQFHPTALKIPGAPRFLLSEALRGEGARLVNDTDEAFMFRYDPAGDLAPRDRVARAIVREADRTGGNVYLSMRHLPAAFVHDRFPLISAACRRAGLDLASDRIPTGPAAHYVMGGVETDLDGRTSIDGLFAAGEAACTGVHGANRLASNSLLEGLVFGARAALAMRAIAAPPPRDEVTTLPIVKPMGAVEVDRVEALVSDARDIMWRSVGLFRDREGLKSAVAALEAILGELEALVGPGDAQTHRALSIATVGRLMASAALRREESRGAHFRSDFPERDDIHWNRHVADVKRTPGND